MSGSWDEADALRALIDTLEEGVVMVDRHGAIVTANPSARRMLGSDMAASVEAARTTGEPLRINDRWLSVSVRAVEASGAVVVAFRDVTEEREARDALEHFAYVASHDLSEPLRVVSSYLTLLRRRYRGRLDADADEFIEFAVDGAARMRALIESLLAYSRAGQHSEPEPVDLNLVAADVLRSLATAMVEAGVQLELSELPTVLGDRLQLEQLLQNLVANALKFRGEPRARVWVRAEPGDGPLASLAVADAGIGIPAEQREHAFAMFGRLHERETYVGTGIGLALCRRIVDGHGGRIWIEERAGGGSVFRFTLPRV